MMRRCGGTEPQWDKTDYKVSNYFFTFNMSGNKGFKQGNLLKGIDQWNSSLVQLYHVRREQR